MKEENANMAARYEREITEGYEARIEGNKVIIELKGSEDERIRKWLIEMVEEVRKANPTNAEHNEKCSEAIAYLEKLKDLTKEGIIKQLEEEFYALHDRRQTDASYSDEEYLADYTRLQSEYGSALQNINSLEQAIMNQHKNRYQQEINYILGIVNQIIETGLVVQIMMLKIMLILQLILLNY